PPPPAPPQPQPQKPPQPKASGPLLISPHDLPTNKSKVEVKVDVSKTAPPPPKPPAKPAPPPAPSPKCSPSCCCCPEFPNPIVPNTCPEVHYHYHLNTSCSCNKAPPKPEPKPEPKPAPPPPPPPKPKCYRIFPVFKQIDCPAKIPGDSDWLPETKVYKSASNYMVHVFLPSTKKADIAANAILADLLDSCKTLLVHGTAYYHSHCSNSSFAASASAAHCCECSLVVPMPFSKSFALPPNTKLDMISASFQAEVLVISIPLI
ncbi:hypothetical protein AYI69_g8073, partial [Smittium culicis]